MSMYVLTGRHLASEKKKKLTFIQDEVTQLIVQALSALQSRPAEVSQPSLTSNTRSLGSDEASGHALLFWAMLHLHAKTIWN